MPTVVPAVTFRIAFVSSTLRDETFVEAAMLSRNTLRLALNVVFLALLVGAATWLLSGRTDNLADALHAQARTPALWLLDVCALYALFLAWGIGLARERARRTREELTLTRDEHGQQIAALAAQAEEVRDVNARLAAQLVALQSDTTRQDSQQSEAQRGLGQILEALNALTADHARQLDTIQMAMQHHRAEITQVRQGLRQVQSGGPTLSIAAPEPIAIQDVEPNGLTAGSNVADDRAQENGSNIQANIVVEVTPHIGLSFQPPATFPAEPAPIASLTTSAAPFVVSASPEFEVVPIVVQTEMSADTAAGEPTPVREGEEPSQAVVTQRQGMNALDDDFAYRPGQVPHDLNFQPEFAPRITPEELALLLAPEPEPANSDETAPPAELLARREPTPKTETGNAKDTSENESPRRSLAFWRKRF